MYEGKGVKTTTNLDGNEVWHKIYGYFCNFVKSYYKYSFI